MKTNYKSKHENACLKKCVLRSVLKQLRSFTALIFDGNLFQRLGADALNDLSHKVSTKICCALPLAFNWV